MTANKPTAIILWTGGKDSALALELSRAHYNVIGLATFAPAVDADFKAHPIPLMLHQADSLKLPHHLVPVVKPYRDSYVAGLRHLAQIGADAVVTGDIASVDGHDNWIGRCAEGVVDTHMPLWSIDRAAHLRQIGALGFRAVVSLARRDKFDASIIGRTIDASFIEEFIALQSQGIDPCGENGEYHTSVLDGPGFSYAIELVDQSTVSLENHWQLSWTQARASTKHRV